MTIEGILYDLVDNPLPNLTIEVWLDGEFMTNVDTDDNGVFTAVYPVPADAALGPVLLEIKFDGSSFTSQVMLTEHGIFSATLF